LGRDVAADHGTAATHIEHLIDSRVQRQRSDKVFCGVFEAGFGQGGKSGQPPVHGLLLPAFEPLIQCFGLLVEVILPALQGSAGQQLNAPGQLSLAKNQSPAAEQGNVSQATDFGLKLVCGDVAARVASGRAPPVARRTPARSQGSAQLNVGSSEGCFGQGETPATVRLRTLNSGAKQQTGSSQPAGRPVTFLLVHL
jgi:hypothetical protein